MNRKLSVEEKFLEFAKRVPHRHSFYTGLESPSRECLFCGLHPTNCPHDDLNTKTVHSTTKGMYIFGCECGYTRQYECDHPYENIDTRYDSEEEEHYTRCSKCGSVID